MSSEARGASDSNQIQMRQDNESFMVTIASFVSFRFRIMAPLLRLKLVSASTPTTVLIVCFIRKINRSIMEHFRKFNVQLHSKVKESNGVENFRDF